MGMYDADAVTVKYAAFTLYLSDLIVSSVSSPVCQKEFVYLCKLTLWNPTRVLYVFSPVFAAVVRYGLHT